MLASGDSCKLQKRPRFDFCLVWSNQWNWPTYWHQFAKNIIPQVHFAKRESWACDELWCEGTSTRLQLWKQKCPKVWKWQQLPASRNISAMDVLMKGQQWTQNYTHKPIANVCNCTTSSYFLLHYFKFCPLFFPFLTLYIVGIHFFFFFSLWGNSFYRVNRGVYA